jgi:hypothetical protein
MEVNVKCLPTIVRVTADGVREETLLMPLDLDQATHRHILRDQLLMEFNSLMDCRKHGQTPYLLVVQFTSTAQGSTAPATVPPAGPNQ